MPPQSQITNPRSQIFLGLALTLALLLAAGVVAYLRHQSGPPLPVLGQVGDFSLTNQLNAPVTLGSLQGRPWLADIIFTRCAGPCPAMTRQLRDIQNALPRSSSARLISLTTDPDFDTPAVLKTYGDRFGTNPEKWWFLTGTKDQIGRLAVDSLKLSRVEKAAAERENPADLFIHSTLLVLVDARGQLRAIYPTTDLNGKPQSVTRQVLRDLKQVERESVANR